MNKGDAVRKAKETEICKNCTNVVVGKGDENSSIMFVGEAPGKNEDEQGYPFVGRAGQNLDNLLQSVGLSLSEIYVTNIVKCRPPKNRDPTKEEIESHTPWLLNQIQEIKPKVVCSLGNYATKFFLSKGDVDSMDKQPGITSLHGKTKDIEIDEVSIKLIPLFHPAALIYKKELAGEWEKDMEVVKEVVDKERSQRKLF